MNASPDITLTLPVPPSANVMWRVNPHGGQYKSPEYKSWLVNAGLSVAEQLHGDSVPGDYAMAVTVPKTRRDIDNFAKPLGDLLEDCGVVVNDRHMRRLIIEEDATRTDVLIRLWALPTPEKKRKRA